MSTANRDEFGDAVAPRPLNGDWTPVRTRLRNWLLTRAPTLADAYVGAVELLANTDFPARHHFIGHAIRDIGNLLPECLAGALIKVKRLEYKPELDAIEKDWPFGDAFFETGNVAPPLDPIPVPRRAVLRVHQLIVQNRGHDSHRTKVEHLVRVLMANETAEPHELHRLATEFMGVAEWFRARAHFRVGEQSHADERILKSKFEAFESMLHSLVGDFFTETRGIDDILQEANEGAG